MAHWQDLYDLQLELSELNMTLETNQSPPDPPEKTESAETTESPYLAVLRVAEEVSKTLVGFPNINKVITEILARVIDIGENVKRDKTQSQALVDKSHVILDACLEFAGLNVQIEGDVLDKLMNELDMYRKSLEDYRVNEKIEASSINTEPDLKTTPTTSDQLEFVDISPPLPPPQQLSTNSSFVALSSSNQGGFFANSSNFVINNSQFYEIAGDLNIMQSVTVTTFAQMLPPKPQYVFEREKEVEQIVSILLDEEAARIVILGFGGMGKTTLAVTVMHNEVVAARFERRLFVSCEGINTVDLVWPEIGRALDISGADSSTNLPSKVLEALQNQGILFCLDNFETIWESAESRVKAEEFLAHLTSVSTLRLIVTMRGTQRPTRVQWSKPLLPPLQSLSTSGSQQIMDVVAGVRDEYVDKLLAEVDGYPLAVTLLAYLLQEGNETSLSLWNRWTKEKTRMIEHGGDNRLLKLDTSIKLSINSVRMQEDPNAANILALFSLLPDGFAESDEFLEELGFLLPGDFSLHQSILTLRRVSLITYDESTTPHRFRILSPIRHYSLTHLNLSPNHKAALFELYLNLIASADDVSDASMLIKISPELHNIRYVIEDSYDTSSSDSRLIDAAVFFTNWSRFMGHYTTDIIQLAINANLHSPTELAHCYSCLGRVYNYMPGQFENAEVALLKALELHEELHNVPRQASNLQSLGELYLRWGEHDNAEAVLNRAVDLYKTVSSIIAEGNCLGLLGYLYIRQRKFALAEKVLNKAVNLHQQSYSVLNEAGDLSSLGKIYISQNRYEEAEITIIRGLELYRQLNNMLGEANNLQMLGVLYQCRQQFDDAERVLLSALQLHTEMNAVLNQVHDLISLVELHLERGKFEEAEAAAMRLIELAQLARTPYEEGRGHRLLQEVHQRRLAVSSAYLS